MKEIHEGGLEGGERGVLDSLPRTTNMAAGQTTYVSADYRNGVRKVQKNGRSEKIVRIGTLVNVLLWPNPHRDR